MYLGRLCSTLLIFKNVIPIKKDEEKNLKKIKKNQKKRFKKGDDIYVGINLGISFIIAVFAAVNITNCKKKLHYDAIVFKLCFSFDKQFPKVPAGTYFFQVAEFFGFIHYPKEIVFSFGDKKQPTTKVEYLYIGNYIHILS